MDVSNHALIALGILIESAGILFLSWVLFSVLGSPKLKPTKQWFAWLGQNSGRYALLYYTIVALLFPLAIGFFMIIEGIKGFSGQ